MKTSARVGLVLLSIVVLGADRAARAEDGGPGEAGSERWWEHRRYEVEGYGGLAGAAAGDLNRLSGYDEQVQQHLFDSQLAALQRSGEIASWGKEQSGERPTIGISWSLGLRVKRRQTPTLAFSVGLQYLRAGGSEDVRFQYTRQEQTGDRDIEELSYSPYTLSVKAWAPLVGIHIGQRPGRTLTLEGFLLGGPLFADFEYASEWSYAFSIEGLGTNGPAFETRGGLNGRGRGTGIAAEVGLRFRYELAQRLAVFAEGSYAYQKVRSPSGSGSQVRGGERVGWEGQWAISEDRIVAPWGSLELERPTNEWPEGSADARIAGFDLDLSGFRLTLGFSLGL